MLSLAVLASPLKNDKSYLKYTETSYLIVL